MIFLTGPHGAGKTTAAKMLTIYKFVYLDLGSILRKKHQKENPEISFGSWCAKNEKKHGESFTDDIIVRETNDVIKKIKSGAIVAKDLVIVGSRSAKGIRYITEKTLLLNGRKNFVIYIDAPENVLIQRYCDREGKRLTIAEFKQILEIDIKMGLLEISSIADEKILNAGSIEEFEKKLKNLVLIKLKHSE